MSSELRVAVVEDGVKLRRSLAEMIESDSRCKCVGAFPSAERALAEMSALRLHVVIMDINLPGMSGVECIRRLSALLPEVHVVVLTVYQDADTIFDALAAGAHGYLIKPVRMTELQSAIHYAESGGIPMTAAIARKVSERMRPVKHESCGPEEVLAPREIEVLDRLAQGLSYKEIAQELGVGYATVCTHTNRIFQKLHVHSRSEATARFLGSGGRGG